MIKLRYLVILCCSICLFALPSSSFANVTRMTDQELDKVTAQAGFSDMLGIIQIKHDDTTGTYYFGGKNGGYLSFTDLSYQGSLGIDPSMITKIVSSNGTVGYEYNLDGSIMNIKNLSTTIRLGTEIGKGSSLGTFSIGQLNVNAHGIMRVTTFK